MKRFFLASILLIITLLSVFSLSTPVSALDPTSTRTPTLTRTPTSTPVALDDYPTLLRVALTAIPSIQSVEVALVGRLRTATITYASEATTPQERADEWVDLLKVVSDTIVTQSLNIDQVIFIMTQGDPVGRLTVSGRDLRLFNQQKLNRTTLLYRAKFLSFAPTATPTLRPTRTPRPTKEPSVSPPEPVQQQSAGGCPSTSSTCAGLTCAQAYACLAAGDAKLDRDNDGIPCESVCGG